MAVLYDDGMNKASIALIAAVLAALGLAAYFVLRPTAPMDVAAPPFAVPAQAPLPAPAPVPASAPVVRFPIEEVLAPASVPVSEPPPLPALAEADATVTAALTDLVGRAALLTVLQTDGFVQRAVATIDNLTRRHAAPRLWPATPMGGRFSVTESGGAMQIGPDNARRYNALVSFVDSVAPARAAAVYRRLYPLFQEAYRELGYGNAYFNDRLVEVIDHVLTTPTPAGPLAITLTEVKGPIPSAAPWLRYEFADPALQSLSAGQRMLLRTGAGHQARLMGWLKAFRTQITK